MVKRVGKYELGRTLGEGTFGKVKYAVNVDTQEAVAIKVLDKEKIQKQNMGNQIKKEISIMKMVKHKFIVGMIEVLASKSKIFIVLDLVTGGELFDKIVKAGRLSEEQALFYFKQLVEGVSYCHKSGVCHRDLKPENLLLDENGNLKISDFGLSSLYVGDADGDGTSRTQILHTTCGTPNYVAPEVLADQGYDGKKADVWSIGVILYVLLAGFLPFDEGTIVALFSKIQAADFTYPNFFSMEMRTVIDLMLVSDPKKRASLDDLRHHDWLREKIPSWLEEEEAVEPVSAPAETDNTVEERTNNSETPGGAVGVEVDSTGTAIAATAAGGADTVEGGVYSSAEEYAANMKKPKTFYPSDKGMGFADAMDAMEESLGKEEYTSGVGSSRPRVLNAFDLINQTGGFALDKLFSPVIDIAVNDKGQLTKRLSSKNVLPKSTINSSINSTSPGPPPHIAEDKSDKSLSSSDRNLLTTKASMRFGGASSRRTGSYHFSSKIVPAQNLLSSIYNVMKEMKFEMEDTLDTSAASGKCRGTLMTAAKGKLGISVYVYTVCSSLSLCEIRRAQGDLLEWQSVYDDLINSKLSHLINRPSGEGEAKADVSPRPGINC